MKVLGTKGNLKKLALYGTKREATQATRSAFQISDTFAGWLPPPRLCPAVAAFLTGRILNIHGAIRESLRHFNLANGFPSLSLT